MVHDGKKPNIVLMVLDDAGWADFRPFGDTEYPTPNVERLASQGSVYYQCYVPQAVCSASRATILTGCYPERHGVYGALVPRVKGLDPKFDTIGDVLKSAGYTTAVFGKWHVGDQPETRPPARGFDRSSGLMYSNDMWSHHPETRYFDEFPLQYWKNGEVIIEDVSPKQQKMLTTWYTEDAVEFINDNHDRPFFLYVPHNMPHVPLYCSDKFEGKSGLGLYADVMMEIDWSLGQIMDALEETGTADNTLVIFTSDNGPWLSYGDHAGQTPFREGKGTSFDGGTRVHCVMAYPGRIPAGTESHRAFCTVDLLPTFAELAGAELPDYEIDGLSVWNLLKGKSDVENPHEYYSISTGRNFEGIVTGDGKWKLHLPHQYQTLAEPGHGGKPGKYEAASIELSLFDMENDPYETTNVAEQYPKIAEKLLALATKHKKQWWQT
ncbi:MAG: sulfatase [Firmicutes bacterium]|nr:sulfatase [Bacillota bacterium]